MTCTTQVPLTSGISRSAVLGEAKELHNRSCFVALGVATGSRASWVLGLVEVLRRGPQRLWYLSRGRKTLTETPDHCVLTTV